MTSKHRSARTCAIAASSRRGVLWLAMFVLAAQLFLTTTHIHVDEEGWVAFPLTQISPTGPAAHLHAHRGSPADESPADAPAGHHRSKHVDCQICQSVPVVSAYQAMAPVELLIPPRELAVDSIASADALAITEPFSPHRPRGPPALA